MTTQELIEKGLLVTNSNERDNQGKIILEPGQYIVDTETGVMVHNFYGYIVALGALC